ncbi:MAG: ACT domain-containing protein [Acidimicrobiales bacterium]
MPTYVVRVWMPDRPGALGAVASRIGAVRGDLVGIDILERGGGRAIDELVVDLPEESLVPLLVSEMDQVDGVDVEDISPAPETPVDPRLDALETATLLVGQTSVPELLDALARHSVRDFSADWAVVVDTDRAAPAPGPVAAVGAVPPAPWLAAFVAGSRASAGGVTDGAGPDDVAWADLDAAAHVVLLGRRGRPLRARERRQLAALARIVDHRWSELVLRGARQLHPSRA